MHANILNTLLHSYWMLWFGIAILLFAIIPKCEEQMKKQFLTGKTALVTGGAQGIGWAIAQSLADHGADVFVCDISAENIEQAKASLPFDAWRDRIHFAQCDVSDRAQVDRWVAQIAAATNRVDILVNNAIYVRWAPAVHISVADSERMMQVGYLGTLYTTKAVLPLMQAAEQGHIINMGSSAGRLFVMPATSAYSAVKAAVDAYTQILQIELAQSPIVVTLVRPAAVAGTDFFRKHVSSSLLPRLGDWLPYVTPPQVAARVLKAIEKKEPIVNVPGYLGIFYFFYALMPGVLRRLMRLGGNGRHDYGQVNWRNALQIANKKDASR